MSLKKTDSAFPPLLKEIQSPPEEIWIAGIFPVDAPCIAIVGTRKPTAYGREAAHYISYELARAGCTVVSGLALGIDTVAHEAALEAGGTTIAVLGSGIDVIAPETNRNLAAKIIAQGCLLTEFPPGTAPYPANFPRRNRIISGLSLGVAVIEADEKSGALITARCASEQGREVFALPGSIFSLQSRGTNSLLRDGAAVLTSPHDILAAFSHLPLFQTKKEQKAAMLDVSSKRILKFLEEKGTMTLAELIECSGLGAQELSSKLTVLELDDLIKRLDDGTYTMTHIS